MNIPTAPTAPVATPKAVTIALTATPYPTRITVTPIVTPPTLNLDVIPATKKNGRRGSKLHAIPVMRATCVAKPDSPRGRTLRPGKFAKK